ncbi:MAG: lactonase family protein [Fimbriiglobus sp.]
MFRMFLSLALLVGVALTASAGDKFYTYFGGYTGGKSGGKGIMVSEFDAATGKLTEPQLAVEVGSPSFLALAPNGKTLYAVGETSGKDGGGVFSYRVDPKTGKLKLLNMLTSGGSGPCHIATDNSGKFAVVSNYGGGSAAIFTINDDGSLKARTAFVQHEGKSINPGNQQGPHAHCGFFDDSGEYALIADLGIDQVVIYKLNRENGTIAPHTTPFVKMPPGTGPRHLHIDGKNKLMFVNGEINSTVNVVSLDLAAGKAEVTQTLSSLPFAVKGNSTAECRIHPNGKFVYVSNRGHNSVAAFKLEGKKLTAIGHAKGDIKIPRNFNIDPTGKWMLIASQDGDQVGVFLIGEDGVPTETKEKVTVAKPVCVKFLAKE